MLTRLPEISDPARRRLRLAISLAVAVVIVIMTWYLLLIIIPLLTSMAVAALLTPLVRLGQRSPVASRWPGIYSVAAAAAATLLAVAAVLGLAALAVYGLVGGVAAFEEVAPVIAEGSSEAWEEVQQVYQERVPENVQEALAPRIADLRDGMLDSGVTALENVARIAESSVSQVIVLLATPISVFQILRRPGALGDGIKRLLPELVRDDLTEMGRLSVNTIMSYIRIQLFLGLFIGTALTLLYWAAGVPLALPLGFLAAAVELLPVIGTTVFILLAIVVVALLDLPKLPLALVIYIGLQIVQNGLLSPRLQGQALGVHPMALVLALALFGLWLGIIGTLVAAPLTGAGWRVFQYVRNEWRSASDLPETLPDSS